MAISSNTNAKAQKGVFSTLSKLFKEENLISNSYSKAIKTTKEVAESDFNYTKKINQNRPSRLKALEKLKEGKVGDGVSKDISIFGNKLKGSQLDDFNDSALNFGASMHEVIGDNPDYDKMFNKYYKKGVSKTKRQIFGRTLSTSLGSYFVDPAKSGIDNMGNKMKFSENEELQKAMARISAGVASGIGVAALATSGKE